MITVLEKILSKINPYKHVIKFWYEKNNHKIEYYLRVPSEECALTVENYIRVRALRASPETIHDELLYVGGLAGRLDTKKFEELKQALYEDCKKTLWKNLGINL